MNRDAWKRYGGEDRYYSEVVVPVSNIARQTDIPSGVGLVNYA